MISASGSTAEYRRTRPATAADRQGAKPPAVRRAIRRIGAVEVMDGAFPVASGGAAVRSRWAGAGRGHTAGARPEPAARAAPGPMLLTPHRPAAPGTDPTGTTSVAVRRTVAPWPVEVPTRARGVRGAASPRTLTSSASGRRSPPGWRTWPASARICVTTATAAAAEPVRLTSRTRNLDPRAPAARVDLSPATALGPPR